MSTLTRKLMRGEIYYIKNFPTHGSEQRSGRPAVIVSNNENNAHSEVVEICYLTLKKKNPLPTHIFIDSGPCINSTVLCEQITSVSVDKIGDYMCRIPEHLEEALDNALGASLALLPVVPVVKVDPKTASAYQLTPQSVMDELTALKNENMALKHENSSLTERLRLTEDANESLKRTPAGLAKQLKEAESEAEMYKRMCNELLDKLISRGAK